MMDKTRASRLKKVVKALGKTGLLLVADNRLPSLVRIIAGKPIRGSWWAHPLAGQIFTTANDLEAHPDVLLIKLISGKLTFVHRSLWPSLYSIGTARETWQLQPLSPLAKSVLTKLDKEGELFSDVMAAVGGYQSNSLKAAIKELEKNILVLSENYHTEKGSHAKRLESWRMWAERVGPLKKIAPGQAKEELSKIVARLNTEFEAKGKLPWR